MARLGRSYATAQVAKTTLFAAGIRSMPENSAADDFFPI
jgi:hypothetical protein